MPPMPFSLQALQRLMQQQQEAPELPELPPSPGMFRRPTTLDEQPFRSQQPPTMGARHPGLVMGPGNAGIEGGMGMTRTPGGVGQGGREWAQERSGFTTPTATAPYRPTEELYKMSFPQAGVGMAPGASQLAQQELKGRVGAEEFEQALGQRQREIPALAEAGLHPSVQRQQEQTARRAAFPAQAQARGMGLQALYNFMGRQETAAGSVEARRAQRDASALNTLERAMTSITGKADLTPEDQAELQRLRQGIEEVRRGVYFLSDLGFDEQELDELADLEQGFGLDDDF